MRADVGAAFAADFVVAVAGFAFCDFARGFVVEADFALRPDAEVNLFEADRVIGVRGAFDRAPGVPAVFGRGLGVYGAFLARVRGVFAALALFIKHGSVSELGTRSSKGNNKANTYGAFEVLLGRLALLSLSKSRPSFKAFLVCC